MALSEKRVLSQVTLLPSSNTINVQWSDQILRDGDVISQSYIRKAYTQDQRAEFEAEVEGAAGYITAIGW